jgi:methionine synthase I (cobalamin-dependent)
LTVSLSNSPDADDAGFRVITFDQVKEAYIHQVRALIAGGADLLLVETIFDSLNAKAALVAIREVFDQGGKELPIMIRFWRNLPKNLMRRSPATRMPVCRTPFPPQASICSLRIWHDI